VTTGERVSTLEHLDELDRLLRDVQRDLVPGAAIPDPAPPPPIPNPPPPSPLPEPAPAPPIPDPALAATRQPQLVAELAAGLVASMRELLAGYERVLAPRAPAARPSPRSPNPSHATISAGPFPSIEAVRAFEAGILRLPGVREVDVRAYEGTDRAVIEVRLDNSNP
jgi:hypothetical protein